MGRSRRRTTLPAPEPSEAGAVAGDVIRARVVPLDELADTLNGWVREGFVQWDWQLLDTEPPAFGEAIPRAFAWASRPD